MRELGRLAEQLSPWASRAAVRQFRAALVGSVTQAW